MSIIERVAEQVTAIGHPDRADMYLQPGQSAQEEKAKAAANMVHLRKAILERGDRADWALHLFAKFTEVRHQALNGDNADQLSDALVGVAATAIAWAEAIAARDDIE